MCHPEFTRQLPLKTAQFYAIPHECEGATGKQIPVIHEKLALARQANRCRLLLQAGVETCFALIFVCNLLTYIVFLNSLQTASWHRKSRHPLHPHSRCLATTQ